jgi:hypothetical protein
MHHKYAVVVKLVTDTVCGTNTQLAVLMTIFTDSLEDLSVTF